MLNLIILIIIFNRRKEAPTAGNQGKRQREDEEMELPHKVKNTPAIEIPMNLLV